MTDSHTSRLESALAGRYKIQRKLGEGGMASVYLAEDIKHERNVALKILKPELAAVIGADRFLAEIKTTANLQHPHILPLFDSGEADGFLYYVMPYIEGETLQDRIGREGQLGVEEAVRVARDVADALDYAHRNDIVHRDIKPANILLHDGRPMVADFGIALAISAAGGGRMTETGLSLGTPHYMSPEQASADRDLSARSDVYSLGCVLYEMLAGQPPHTGPSAQSILVRILTEDPRNVTELRRTVPPHVAAAVMKSIEKLPADRFDSARAFMDALEDPAFTYEPASRAAGAATTTRAVPPVPSPVSAHRSWMPWAAAIILLAVAAWGWLGQPESKPVRRMVLVLDSIGASFGPSAVLSPDGSRVAYVGADGGLWLRPLRSLESQVIPEASRVTAPFFAPDGQRVGFRSGPAGTGRLSTVSLGGGPPVELASGELYPGSTWSDDGYVYFCTPEGALRRVREEGGPVETVADTAAGWWAAWPEALPGGEFVVVSGPGGIAAVETATGDVTPLLDGFVDAQAPLMARFAGGYLFWVNSSRTLMAAPFNPRRLELTGPPVALSSNIVSAGGGSAEFDVSEDGTLIYAVGASRASILQGENIGWVDRNGNITIPDERLSGDVGDFDFLSLGPNPRYIAAEVQTSEDGAADEEHHVWIYDVDQQTFVRLTLEGRNNTQPRWADERNVAYVSDRIEGSAGIFAQPIDGSGPPEALFVTDRPILDFDVSPADGTLAITLGSGAEGSSDIVRVDPAVEGDPMILAGTRFDEAGVDISGDGRWIAYISNESERREVYVRAYADGSRRSAISTTGADRVRWSQSGSELFYVAFGERVTVASLDMGERISVRSRSELFGAGAFELGGPDASYDVDPEGERLLVIVESGGEQRGRLVMVLNVLQELEERGQR